jgi:hypothetical protein
MQKSHHALNKSIDVAPAGLDLRAPAHYRGVITEGPLLADTVVATDLGPIIPLTAAIGKSWPGSLHTAVQVLTNMISRLAGESTLSGH